MLETGRAGHGPGSRQRHGIALVRAERGRVGVVGDRDVRQVGQLRQAPGLRAVGQVGVRQVGHGGHVLERQAAGLDGQVEALGRRGRGHDRHGRIAVAAEHDLQQVGLLGLGGHARGGPGALHVDDDEGQLHHDRETHGLRLEGDARAGGSRQPQRSTEGGADGRADGRDLVLRLEGAHAEVLVGRELVQDLAGGRDGVGGVDEVPPGQLGGGHEAQGGGLVAVDVAIGAGGQPGRLDAEAVVEDLRRLAEGVAGLERPQVGLQDDRPSGELGLDPGDGGLHGALEEPEHDAQGEEVLGQVDLLGGHLEALEGARVERADRDLEDVVVGERAVRQRVGRVAGLGQVLGREGVLVDDDGAAGRHVAEVGPQGRRVHGHQDVRRVAGRVDLRGGEADLEAGDAGQRAGRGADLGREVRQGGDVVAEDGSRAGELRPGHLHAVAGIAREADGDSLQFQDRGADVLVCLGGHAGAGSWWARLAIGGR